MAQKVSVNNYQPYWADHVTIVCGAILSFFIFLIGPLYGCVRDSLKDCEVISFNYSKVELSEEEMRKLMSGRAHKLTRNDR